MSGYTATVELKIPGGAVEALMKSVLVVAAINGMMAMSAPTPAGGVKIGGKVVSKGGRKAAAKESARSEKTDGTGEATDDTTGEGDGDAEEEEALSFEF